MKKILLITALVFVSALSVNAQTRVVVRRTPASKIVVVHRPLIRPIVVTPVRTVVAHPVVRRRIVVVR